MAFTPKPSCTIAILLLTIKLTCAQFYSPDTAIIEEGLTTRQYLNYARELYGQSNYGGCLKTCDKVLAADPANYAALATQAHVYWKERMWDTCIVYEKRVLAANNNVITPELYNDLNDAYRETGNWQMAINLGKQFLLTKPQNAESVNIDIGWEQTQIPKTELSPVMVNVFFLLVIFVSAFLFWLKWRSLKQINTGLSMRPYMLEGLILSASVASLLYQVFFHFAPAIRSTNLEIPTQQLLQHVQSFSFEHDGLEGLSLYAMITIAIFITLGASYVADFLWKNRTIYIFLLLTGGILSYLTFYKIGFFPPEQDRAFHLIPLTIITLSIIVPLFLIEYWSWKLAAVICAIALLPICFISTGFLSNSDSGFIFSPALRLANGVKPSEIYFQYDLFPSLIELIGIKMNMAFEFFQYAVQFAHFALFMGLLLFGRSFFRNKNLAVLLLAFAVITRVYANDWDLMCMPQETALRLDMWFVILLLVFWKSPYHWLVGAGIALLIIFHRNFAYIYLAAYLQLLVVLFAIDIFDNQYSGPRYLRLRQIFLKHLMLVWHNLALIATGVAIATFIMGGFAPAVVRDYAKIGLSMLPISQISFYWYVPVVLGWVTILLIKYRNIFPQRYFSTGVFVVFLAIGNSLYFLGRSHENNILNLAAVLATVLYLFFDLLIAIYGNSGAGLPEAIDTNARKMKRYLLWSLPFIAILFATYFYGHRIDSRVKEQYSNLTKGRFICPTTFAIDDYQVIHQLAGKDSNVYFLDYDGDFPRYYYGHYNPPGYINPACAWLIKKELASFLQQLLREHYSIISLQHSVFSEVAPFLSYNRLQEKGGYILAANDSIKPLLSQNTDDIMHLPLKDGLSPWGLEYHVVNLPQQFTLQCLVRPDTMQNPGATILDNEHATIGNRGFRLAQRDSLTNQFYFEYGTNTDWLTTNSFKLEPGKWQLLTIAPAGNELNVFVNGKKVTSMKIDGPLKNSPVPLMIGNCSRHDCPFHGDIKEIKITTEVLPDSAYLLPKS